MRESTVNAAARLEIIKKRDKKYLIYHQVNVTQPYSTLNLEFQVDNATTTNLVVLVRHNKMPTLKECEFVKIIGNIEVGKGAWVGAGSVVIDDVPAHTTVAGVPAKKVGEPRIISPALEMDQQGHQSYEI